MNKSNTKKEYNFILSQITEAIASRDFIDNYETFGYAHNNAGTQSSRFFFNEDLTLRRCQESTFDLEGVTDILESSQTGRKVSHYLSFVLPEATPFMKGMSESSEKGPVVVEIIFGKKGDNNDSKIKYIYGEDEEKEADRLCIKWEYLNKIANNGSGITVMRYGIFIDNYIKNVYLRPVFKWKYGDIPGSNFFDNKLMFPYGHSRGANAVCRKWTTSVPLACTQHNFTTLMALGKFGLVSKVYIVFEKK
ncbi:MAG: hypothetical protein LBR91_02685 [Puniceicoccales bacterium]|nr:hypothetical protein [Puniceicoccales bacterium]